MSLVHALQTRFKSYGARNQLDVSGRAPQYLEWDRNYVTVLGVANKRLYEFRLQSSHRNFEAAKVCLHWSLRLCAAHSEGFLVPGD